MAMNLHLSIYYMSIIHYIEYICTQKVMDYPKVSKALRDMAKTTPHRQEQHHHCSLSAFQGTGHQDLDKIIEDRSPLCFDLELLKVEKPGEYKQDNWAMSNAEKEMAIPKLKEEGNLLYKQGSQKAASLKYYEALSYLEEQLIREKPHCEEWRCIAIRKIPFLLNYAQCKMVLKEYADVIRHTTMVLELESENAKALYRRGMACSASWDVQGAERDLNKVTVLQPSLKRVVEQELQDLAKRVREKDVAEKERLKGKMF